MSKALVVQVAGQSLELKQTALDRVIGYVSPERALVRTKARAMLALSGGGYTGARQDRRATKTWWPWASSPDAAVLSDLDGLRARSRDLVRNSPLAGGAVNTVVSNVVGTGLKLQARPDREVLGLDDAAADAWESQTEREWRLWSESQDADLSRTLDWYGIQELAFRQTLENGDVFLIPRFRQRPGASYNLCLQMIEGDRVCNPGFGLDNEHLSGGVEKDDDGAPVAYHILKQHPGSLTTAVREWIRVPAFDEKTGFRSVHHLFRQLRPGQSRGVPYLAPVIEPLKQLARYTEAELMAAVVSGMFTVFIKREMGGLGGTLRAAPAADTAADAGDDYRLGNGAIIELPSGDDITSANPGRPNTAFDPFVQAILRQIGVALELPFEILIKHYTSSYSAARAAMLDAWRFFQGRRVWLARQLCAPIYAIWMTEAVARGRVKAPGFFADPLISRAWLGADWIGPARGQVDELKEVKAARERINIGISTIAEETAQMTGGDWERKHIQRGKEVKLRRAAGLEAELNPPPSGEGVRNAG